MRKFACLLLLLSLAATSAISALTWHLEVTSITQLEVLGTLTVTNESATAVILTFGNSQWATILLDGQSAPFMTFPVVTFVTIQPGQTHTEYVGYSFLGWVPATLIPVGQYIAQGAIEDGSQWVGVGNYVAVNVLETYHFMDFELEAESVSSDSMSFEFSMTNTNDYPFEFYYNTNSLRLHINEMSFDFPVNSTGGLFNLQPGETHTKRLLYNPTEAIPDGNYAIRVSLQDYNYLPLYNVPETLNVTVGTSAITDVLKPVISLSAYPNPFRNKVNFTVKSEYRGDAQVRIYNIKGELVRSLQMTVKGNEEHLEWDGKNDKDEITPFGLYIFKVSTGSSSKTIKMIKLE